MVSIKKLGIGGGGMFVFGILFGWCGFPSLLRSQIKKVRSSQQFRPFADFSRRGRVKLEIVISTKFLLDMSHLKIYRNIS